jgi:hypothetical protein
LCGLHRFLAQSAKRTFQVVELVVHGCSPMLKAAPGNCLVRLDHARRFAGFSVVKNQYVSSDTLRSAESWESPSGWSHAGKIEQIA